MRRISSGLADADIIEAQKRLQKETQDLEGKHSKKKHNTNNKLKILTNKQGSVLFIKRKRSNTLKALPKISENEEEDRFLLSENFKEHTDFVSKVKFFPKSTTVSFFKKN